MAIPFYVSNKCFKTILLTAITVTVTVNIITTITLPNFNPLNHANNPATNFVKHKNGSSTDTVIGYQDPRCIGLELEDKMDKLLSSYRQVYIVMPAKAGGSTTNTFVKNCMKNQTESFANYDNILNRPGWMRSAHLDTFKQPSLISSHLYTENTLVNLVKQATRKSLIVYIHREDTDRLLSAIKQVVYTEVCNKKKYTNSQEGCRVTQDKLVQLIEKEAWNEISYGMTNLLKCNTYSMIEENAPNLVFIDYKQLDKLLKLVSKHHCPGQALVRKNVASEKKSILVELPTKSTNLASKNSTNIMKSIESWLEAKMGVIELALNLKEEVSCQVTTRKMENNLMVCPDKTLQFSTSELL